MQASAVFVFLMEAVLCMGTKKQKIAIKQVQGAILSFNRSAVLFVTNFDYCFVATGCPSRSDI